MEQQRMFVKSINATTCVYQETILPCVFVTMDTPKMIIV